MFQTYRFGAGEIPAEMLNIFDSCAAPAVNRLIIIANRGDFCFTSCQNPEPGILNGIGILKLIHQNMLETLLIMAQQSGAF